MTETGTMVFQGSKYLYLRLSDLAHAARNGSIETQRLVASIFLELVFNEEIRQQLTTRNIPGK